MKLIARESGLIDLARAEAGPLLVEDSLHTAVIISLLTDRRADDDDRLPQQTGNAGPVTSDKRGWVGDIFSGRKIGSRLWLLKREKQTAETLARAIDYAKEALVWLKEDGHVVAITVDAEWATRGRMHMRVRLALPGGDKFEVLLQPEVVYAV